MAPTTPVTGCGVSACNETPQKRKETCNACVGTEGGRGLDGIHEIGFSVLKGSELGETRFNDSGRGSRVAQLAAGKRTCSEVCVLKDDDVSALINEWEKTQVQRGGPVAGFDFLPSASSSSGGVHPTPAPLDPPTKQCPTQ